MCGIACIVGMEKGKAEMVINKMMDTMPYRGPNDRGVWQEDGITLGHLRLSIIDTSSAGHQPMKSADGRYILSFNGEIFNYIELREELRKCGSIFKTETDSEVILEAYRQWGEDCVTHFNGMWAFALWDTQEKLLFFSRDRFGIKPMYLLKEGKMLAIASQMQALLQLKKPEPDFAYLYSFFDRKTALGDDRTVFKDITHLRPGHTGTWKNDELRIKRFWHSEPSAFAARSAVEDPVEAFRELMLDSIKLRLRSDVPLGVCLSGGIDSSVIAVGIKHLGITPQTFSTVYSEADYSEERFMDSVNAHIGAKSTKITPAPEDFFPTLEEIIEHHAEPVRMPGVFSHWFVMKCAHKDVTVVLDGQGADELLAGYNQYTPSYAASLLRDVLTFQSSGEALSTLQKLHGLPVLETVLRMLPPHLRAHIGRTPEKGDLFTEHFKKEGLQSAGVDAEELSFFTAQPSPLDRDMYRDFIETNLPMLLRYEDRNSMAFSMEARVPFLDYRVVEFCQGLSYRYKRKGNVTKWILREAFKDLLPRDVLERRDKKGFPTPLALWMQGPLKAEVRKRLENAAFYDANLIDRTHVLKLLSEHENGVKDHERTLFRLLTLDLWLRRFF